MKITRSLRFKNPMNDYVLECPWPCVFGLVFGPFSLGLRGAWITAAGWILLTAGSAGFFWILFPLISTRLLRQHYLIAGWHELPADYFYFWGEPSLPAPAQKLPPIKREPIKAAMPSLRDEPASYKLD